MFVKLLSDLESSTLDEALSIRRYLDDPLLEEQNTDNTDLPLALGYLNVEPSFE